MNMYKQINLVWLFLKRPDQIEIQSNSLYIEELYIFDIKKKTHTIPFDRIVSMTKKINFLQLLLNCGSLEINYRYTDDEVKTVVLKSFTKINSLFNNLNKHVRSNRP